MMQEDTWKEGVIDEAIVYDSISLFFFLPSMPT